MTDKEKKEIYDIAISSVSRHGAVLTTLLLKTAASTDTADAVKMQDSQNVPGEAGTAAAEAAAYEAMDKPWEQPSWIPGVRPQWLVTPANNPVGAPQDKTPVDPGQEVLARMENARNMEKMDVANMSQPGSATTPAQVNTPVQQQAKNTPSNPPAAPKAPEGKKPKAPKPSFWDQHENWFDSWMGKGNGQYGQWGMYGALGGGLLGLISEALSDKEKKNYLGQMLLHGLLGGMLTAGGRALYASPNPTPAVAAGTAAANANKPTGLVDA